MSKRFLTAGAIFALSTSSALAQAAAATPASTGINWTSAAATINGIVPQAAPIMTALVAVAAGLMAFRKIRGLIR